MNTVTCRVLASILCLSLVSGCTTFKPLEHSGSQSAISLIRPGDEIRVTTRDSKAREFKVKEATDQQLVGENERVNLSDVTEIDRREFSTGKTVALAVLSIIIIGILTASTSGGWSNGP